MSKESKGVYCIIKELVLKNGKTQSVILLDGGSEILEYTDKSEAENIANIFETNSDSGYKYYVRKIK
jgi:hypothetical protein